VGFSAKLKKFLHWESSKKPEVSLSAEIYEQLKPFRLPLILLQLVMLIGTLGYIYIEDYTIMEALFQTAYTFSTTGFGSLREDSFSDWGIIFTTNLIIAGFVVFTFSIGIMLEVINKGTLFKLLKERKMLYKIARLKNHFVICYHNEYTIELSRELRENHIPFVVIDPMKEFSTVAEKYRYPYFVNEEPHTQEAMLKSHLSSAKGLITFSKSIADNIAQISSVRLFEKELKRRPYYIISSAENELDTVKLKKLGADSVISPTKLMSQRVSAMAIRPDMENLLEKFVYKQDTPLDLEEIYVPKSSWIVLKKLKETHLRDIANVSIVGITQKDGKFIPMPRGDAIITSECKLLVIGGSKNIKSVKAIVLRREKPRELKYV